MVDRAGQRVVADAGFTFLPHRDNPPKDQHNRHDLPTTIAAKRCRRSQLNGLITDDGVNQIRFARWQADRRAAHRLATVRPRGGQL